MTVGSYFLDKTGEVPMWAVFENGFMCQATVPIFYINAYFLSYSNTLTSTDKYIDLKSD